MSSMLDYNITLIDYVDDIAIRISIKLFAQTSESNVVDILCAI